MPNPAKSLFVGALMLLACASGAMAQQVELKCNAGPLHRSFGGNAWLVYGCNDGKSLVVASDAGNPASPFVFIIAWSAAGYGVSGEGNGDRAVSAAALQDLSALTNAQIVSLFTETQTVQPE
jgi:hypothetical protein